MWRVRYDRTVRNYIYDSYPYTHDIWRAIRALERSEGIPVAGRFSRISSVYLWTVTGHLVVYERQTSTQVIDVAYVKPLDD